MHDVTYIVNDQIIRLQFLKVQVKSRSLLSVKGSPILTLLATQGGGPSPVPVQGAGPLGRAFHGVALVAGEALVLSWTQPLVPGPELSVVQLDLARTQHIWVGGRS